MWQKKQFRINSMAKIKILGVLLTVLVLSPVLVRGVEFDNPLEYVSLDELVDEIANTVFYLALVLVPLMVLIGAFFIITAGEDSSRLKKGQNFIIYALIGTGVVLFAKGIVAAVRHLLGG